ncbi:hypothetical protein ILUMI_14044 [Ignelater luminosus]|uniref:Uncharacterized protein n=1 Tax=Ignelater luminosus TaxID=2038154 RepID=A0A8K0CT88_IGNLU|nr:hypothetical protein ILUMI_15092 [Ignelater luminosus]KAF2892129.1 hypothetical protein ILUMI_14044 [Ignelater luminosus]
MDEDCIKELNLNKTLIETISNELIIPEDNTALNSFLSCTWKNEGTLNENDEINWDKVEKTFATSLQQELQELPTLDAIIAGGATASAIKLCKEDGIRGTTPGQTIAKIQNCIIKRVFK